MEEPTVATAEVAVLSAKRMIATEAPNAAPWEIPRALAEARGFLSVA